MNYHLQTNNKNNTRQAKEIGWSSRTLLAALLGVMLLLSTSLAFASGSLVASWDAVTDSDLAGYKIYYGTTSGDITNWQIVDAGNTTQYVLNELQEGTRYYMVVTAYDWAGNESGPSTQVDAVATSRGVDIAYDETNGLVISWDAVTGADSYEIHKSNEAYFTPGTPEATITSTTFTDNSYSRTADFGSYYIVKAKSAGSDVFTFSRVGAFNLKLQKGRNLVNVPFINSDSSLTNVLGKQLTGSSFLSRADKVYMWNGNDYEMAWLVEGTSSSYEGKWIRKAGDMESTIRLRPEQSFWIEINDDNPVPADSVITVCGRVNENASQTYDLVSGPNFVGSSYPVDVALSESGLGINAISGGPNGAAADKVMHWIGPKSFDVAWLVNSSGTSWDGEWVNERGNALSGMSFKAGHGYIIMIKNDNTASTWQFPKPN